jgi:lysyl-tRNA synthetase, class II
MSAEQTPAETEVEIVETDEERQSKLTKEMAHRHEKLTRLAEAGINPYPYRFDRTHTIGEVRAAHGDMEPGSETEVRVSLAGRMMLQRDTGKLVFAQLVDRTGAIQLFASKSVMGDESFDRLKDCDLGDWLGVHGIVMTTRTGELSVKVDGFELLSKAVRPMPDKWKGLSDTDTRFRQRYADLIVTEEARRNFEIRHGMIASFRRTLARHEFIEVETPMLHVEAGGAHARPFVTHHNALDMQLYLRIALELHLKRLIVGGMERVYEIGRVFRNEGISTRHNPEFTMMELYQAFADVNEVMAITEELITTAALDTLGTSVVQIGDLTHDLAAPWRRVRMVDLVEAKTGVAVHPTMALADARALAERHGVKVQPQWGTGKLIEELFEATSEAELIEPTFVTGHPVEISPLARADRNDPHLTERFELFVGGRELANGYTELNDPVVQRERFEDEQRQKEAGNAEAGSVDEDYLRALEYGLPPTGGLGIGMDRVAMLLAATPSIKEVILFPTLRPEVF